MVEEDGFLEWAEFLGEGYGTPWPSPPRGFDVLLEIDLQGAEQVRRRHPEAVVVMLLPPSPEIQADRLRMRGDDPETVARRVEIGRTEERQGRSIAAAVVVNDDVERAVAQVVAIIAANRTPLASSPASDLPRRIPLARRRPTLMDPPVEDLLDKVDSKFTLVALSSKRARQINSYYNQLGESLGVIVPPQVTSVSGKPLTIAFEEIASSKTTYHRTDGEDLEVIEDGAEATGEAAGLEPGEISFAEDTTVIAGGGSDGADVVVDGEVEPEAGDPAPAG
jgi:DNA-directed RNA polymerase subunit omega